MLSLSQMLLRFFVAMVLGALMGWEREIQGKEAGIRTSMLVATGAAMFTMIGLAIPYTNLTGGMQEALARSTGGMNVIANIVIGIGFLGAGIIFRDERRVHGLTTAAVVWVVAAIGTLCGLGILNFAITAGVIVTAVLYVLRGIRG
jgi:putative Mg2+ transporter-C (MgtC) family protein